MSSTFSFGGFIRILTALLQQMSNRSYLKSQKLKAIEADRQKIALLEVENAALKKDKAALEQRVKMLKEVIQKNRGNLLICVLRFSFLVIWVLMSFFVVATDGTKEHQKELQELQVAA